MIEVTHKFADMSISPSCHDLSERFGLAVSKIWSKAKGPKLLNGNMVLYKIFRDYQDLIDTALLSQLPRVVLIQNPF